MAFLQEYSGQLLTKITEHFMLSMTALLLGILVAIPLGLLISKNKKLSKIMIAISSVLQTIPSLALLAIMVPIFGVGKLPAVLALFIYSLLPILRNTVLGMESVGDDIIDAAKGMGMTQTQIIFKVQVPLALQVIMTGVRLSSIYVIAWTSLAAYIGAGGLGDFIFNGLNNFAIDMIIAGTVPITVMALMMDLIFDKVETQLIKNYGRPVRNEGVS
ncbi:ABC transporter permease [Erysipelothrix urinaevulpis]|uniref:ABC transporter permease n=1 Tax=Erysipelothrix urinaevulpis TaxID=2683717 RepID=UPI001F22D18B|nr:ABC transporter permease [Erysipelothrix urinaevulpis]